MADSPRTRVRRVGQEAFFAMLAQLFYDPEASVSSLADNLRLAVSTVKRMLGFLRRRGAIRGRAGAITVDVAHVPALQDSYCAALVLVDADCKKLRSLRPVSKSCRNETEEELLDWLCQGLPRSAPYRGKVIVERGHIAMGAVDFSMVLTVYAAFPGGLFNFVRLGVELCDGVNRARTMMIAHTVAR